MKRDPLLWAALVAVLVVLASAEYKLAVACGFGQYVAAGLPASLDIYAIAALRARRDVLAVVVTLVAVNAASHLVEVGLLPVEVPLVVAVSAVAPLVLWRVHRLADVPDEQPVKYAAEAEAEPVPAAPEPPRPIPEAVPAGVRLLPIVARPAPAQKALVSAAEYTRTRTEVRAEWTVPGDCAPTAEKPLTEYRLGLAAEQFKDELLAGRIPSIRAIKERLSVGQNRAKEIQNGFRQGLAEWQAARTEATV